jgi:P-type Cu+ transporter
MTRPVSLSVEGMSCASCVARVARGLGSVDGISDVSVNLAAEAARFQADGPGSLSAAATKLEALGYPARKATVTLTIGGMTCASCVGRVERTLAA